jgi:ATP-binding cassette, subfamily C (CFTR/MRP), member 1
MLEVNLPQILSQFFTFAAFAIVAKVQGSSSLSISQAITSLSILTLLSTPLSGLLIAIPQGIAALGCFQRIQEFLLGEPRLEQRVFGSDSERVQDSSFPESALVFPSGDIELTSSPTLQRPAGYKNISPNDQIVIKTGHFGWSETNPTVINDVTMQILQNAQLTIVVGSVGCGKSTFLKALLGETSTFNGLVYVKYLEIAFCDQTPWIVNGSIRDNIVGESIFEDAWYNSVVWACALDVDLQQMSNGDATIVGSKGVMLSGGQKQRLVSTLSIR